MNAETNIDGIEQSAAAQVPTLGTATSAEFNFTFRTEKIRDDDGKVIGTGRKHPAVKAPLPIPTTEQIVTYLQAGGKVAELIHDAVYSAIKDAAKNFIDDWRENQPADATFTPTNFDLSKLTLEAIASTPASQRKNAAVSDEDITAFLDDYHHVMVTDVGYEEKRVKLAMAHFKVRLVRIKNDKEAVKKLLDLLNIWATKTEALEDHQAFYEELTRKADKYLKEEAKQLSSAL
jgi:hypothetical protein